MDRRDEKRWREKVSVGTVKIAKSAWVWDDGRSFGQSTVYGKERPRDHEWSRGEDKYWGKERVIYEYEREHGEEIAKWEDQGEERPPGEDRSRGEGRSPGEERSRGEERPRRVERSHDQERFPKEKEQVQERAGSSCMVCCPAMSPVSPVWPRKPKLWAFCVLLLVLLLPWKSWAVEHFQHCHWLVVLNNFDKVGSLPTKARFLDQEPIDTVTELFQNLADLPIDPQEKYMSFPYYLKVSFFCTEQNDEELVRKSHLMGMRPLILISYRHPVNFYRWETENLQIQMEAAPLRTSGFCSAEVMCTLNWYAPMPIKNGSVVMSVDISSNGLGVFIPRERFYININGFLKKDASGKTIFTVGYEVRAADWEKSSMVKSALFIRSKSRPLWYTVNHSPVLILGGIENEKVILLSDTNFQDYSLIELSIDSCWVGSYYCPMLQFSATIHDAISTESTLFIRQNQLVYYFTGRYTTLFDKSHSSSSWVRVLANECIKKLCPVFVSGNGSEYILALTTGKNEGYVHFGTITGSNCSINWATYIADEKVLLLLVEAFSASVKVFHLVKFNTENQTLSILYTLPRFIPEGHELEFLVLDGTETYTNTSMIPKGLFFNTFNNMLYIWGNFILQSYNRLHFIFLADFPKDSTIKYMVNSYQGDMAFVTETDEKMQQSSLYADKEFLVSIFYEDGELYQLVYLHDTGNKRLVKRVLPVAQVLLFDQNNPQILLKDGNRRMLAFSHMCPFKVMRLRDLPKTQHLSRQEIYHAPPPLVSESQGFHNNKTLAIYQGLIYYLLWLHSKYDKPYADPVHDPTWRWWEHKTQFKDYYFYLSSNWLAEEGMYIDMSSYKKLYNVSKEHGLPEIVFLDKGNSFSFTVFLSSHGDTSEFSTNAGSGYQIDKNLAVAVAVADPECLEASVNQEVLINRRAVLYKITVKDRKVCYDQGLSGYNLKKTSLMVKVWSKPGGGCRDGTLVLRIRSISHSYPQVLGSSGKCFQTTYLGANMQVLELGYWAWYWEWKGHLMVPLLIGCPPGKRLAFDVTYTIIYSRDLNKHYFDCAVPNLEMPCFLYRDLFQPFFLVQDMVTGASGSFLGSYLLLVVGGGPTLDTIRDYTEEEIYHYNSPLDKTNSRIWTTNVKTTTPDKKFYIMNYQSPGIEGVDTSTYCDYKLIFVLHIHGLPLSGKRSLFIVIVSSSLLLGLVVFYILFCLVWPHIVGAWASLRWKINNIMASESYYTYATSNAGFSIHSQSGSEENSRAPSKAGSKEDNVAKK
ncbi:hypothetical protein ACRRTK_000589 [Alexandromys fortis]